MRRKGLVTALIAVMFLVFTLPVFAFDDLNQVAGADKINALESQGVLQGDGSGHFQPKQSLTYAGAAAMIVGGLGLNLDNYRFIKAPQASDYYTMVPDNAWYAQDFVVAQLNGVKFPKDVKPSSTMTKEQFSVWLEEAISYKWSYVLPMFVIRFHDYDMVDSGDMPAVRALIAMGVAKLDANKDFHPNEILTRAEAAVMIYNAEQFGKDKKLRDHSSPVQSKPPVQAGQVSFQTKTLSGDVKEVTLIWPDRPTTGYGIAVDKIVFPGQNQAVIYYTLHKPAPGTAQGQIVTTAKTATYVSADLKVSIQAQP